MDHAKYCELFYSSHFLPVAYYDENGLKASAGYLNSEDPYPFVYPKLKDQKSPSVYISSDAGLFGLVRDETGYFIIGPAYSSTISEKIIRSFMTRNAIPAEKQNEVTEFLSGLPLYTYSHFLNLLLYLHFTFSGEILSLEDVLLPEESHFPQMIGRKSAEQIYEERDAGQVHGTYSFEQRMIGMISEGSVEELKHFLLQTVQSQPIREGILADTPLRQAKNILIGLVTRVGKDAAIPAGVDVEETYQLIDSYIQECERLQSVEQVTNLQFNMIMDFTARVAQHKMPPGISVEIQNCMQFISMHINEPLSIQDVVSYLGKSRAYVCDRFKAETGMSIGQYITMRKVREAKSLLRYTDKPLSEISSYLAFSSQSYFQSVFRKTTGCTPLEYRNKKKQ